MGIIRGLDTWIGPRGGGGVSPLNFSNPHLIPYLACAAVVELDIDRCIRHIHSRLFLSGKLKKNCGFNLCEIINMTAVITCPGDNFEGVKAKQTCKQRYQCELALS